MEEYKCKFCNKQLKNKNSLTQHEIRCSKNPNKLPSYLPHGTPWNKGLTKENDERVMKQSVALVKHFQNETKETVLTYKAFKVNNYIGYYIPNHHLANKSGIVYEHLLMAEAMLDRRLLKEEVVHHKDENRENNKFSNLIVFKNKSEHTKYHQYNCSLELIKCENGSYMCAS